MRIQDFPGGANLKTIIRPNFPENCILYENKEASRLYAEPLLSPCYPLFIPDVVSVSSPLSPSHEISWDFKRFQEKMFPFFKGQSRFYSSSAKNLDRKGRAMLPKVNCVDSPLQVQEFAHGDEDNDMFTVRKVWGKVMFLHLCVIIFTGGGGLCPGVFLTENPLHRDPSGQRPRLQRDPAWTETPPTPVR